MKPTSESINLARLAREAVQSVDGKPFTEALLAFLTCTTPPCAADYREWATREDGLVAARLFPFVQVNRDGKYTAKRDAVDGDPTSDATYSEMVSRARHHQNIIAMGCVLPALRCFQASFPLRRDEIDLLIGDLPLLPAGRRRVIARALHAGFVEDWIVVAHLLPPQLEHIVRCIFEESGAIASGLSRSTQHEHDLDNLLWRAEADTIFGEDWLLNLRCSLIHPWGANLRNLMAHGLLDDGSFASAEVIYMWWLSMRLIFLSRPRAPLEPGAAAPSDDEVARE